MSLSAKEKAQLQSKRIKRLKFKGMALYLYHPASDSFLPAQCDAEGRMVIDPADLDNRYYTQSAADLLFEEFLKLDGSKEMAAHILFDTHLTYNLASSAKKLSSTWIRTIQYATLLAYSSSAAFRARNASGGSVAFQTLYGGIQSCARLISLASNNGAFEIPRAGDITFLDGKSIETAHATNNELFFKGYIGSTPYTLATMKNNEFTINSAGDIIPSSLHGEDLGSASKQWRAMFCNIALIDERIRLSPETTPASAAEGDIYYDVSANKLKVYNGSAWETITSA